MQDAVTRATILKHVIRPGEHPLYLYLELLPDTRCSRVTAATGLRLRQHKGDVCEHGENPHSRQQELQRNHPGPLQTGPLVQDQILLIYQISKKIFNMMNRNYVLQLDDAVRQVKRPNGGNKFAIQTRKIAKLTFNVV